MNFGEKKRRLKEVAKQVRECKKCLLYKNATHPVPGEGNPEAKIMFIGEGPGYWEDQQGRPFVGQAGKLLDELLQLIKISRMEVFITNVVKHRPLGNRDPLPEEIEACKEFLDAQIEIIDPQIIVTLGRFSLNKFLPGEFISKVHGQARFVDFAGKRRIVIPMYHPAAALRSEKIMKELKQDFQKIPKFLENDAIKFNSLIN
ncbi:MAG: uracil-DNA glycosylase [Microgenomates group bacterium]